LPEWGHIDAELRRRGVTLALLWEEYRRFHPDGYGYSRAIMRLRLILSGMATADSAATSQ
jgi:transposase